MRTHDQWSRWLLETRFGGDLSFAARETTTLESIRDNILRYSGLRQGETLLDVGSGTGLVALAAAERVGCDGHVIFSDISDALLAKERELAQERGLVQRCSFVRTSADDLSAIPDASLDVVTTRSVLIYVKDKASALREFFRVLRPGGRISLYEPIPRFTRMHERVDEFMGMDVGPVSDIAARLKDYFAALQPDSDPAYDFDENDLIRHCEAAGFERARLLLEITIEPAYVAPWLTIMSAPVNPSVPSVLDAMHEVLTDDERRRFEDYLRPRMDAGIGGAVDRVSAAYLHAAKP